MIFFPETDKDLNSVLNCLLSYSDKNVIVLFIFFFLPYKNVMIKNKLYFSAKYFLY